MNNNTFFSVFSTLRADENIKELFSNVVVKKILRNQEKGFVHIHIESKEIISDNIIKKLEKEISKNVFDNTCSSLKIIESYDLSLDYSVEKIYNAYYETILSEIKTQSYSNYILYKDVEVLFKEKDTIVLQWEDSMIGREKARQIQVILENIFLERFQRKVTVVFDFQVCKREELKEEYHFASAPQINKMGTVPERAKRKKQKMGTKSKMVHGKDFTGVPISLDEPLEEMQQVVIEGQVFNLEGIHTKTGKVIVCFSVTDFKDSIRVKIFLDEEAYVRFSEQVEEDSFVSLKGKTKYDDYEKSIVISPVYGLKMISDFRFERKDDYPEKRVELHCHTKISEMDGLAETSDLIKRAIEWGHKAIAITDHGGLQAYSEAYHELEKQQEKFKEKKKELDFKIIYGLEGYLVEDMEDLFVNVENQSFQDTFVVFDLETTGLRADKCKIIEIGAVKIENGNIIDTYSALVNPEERISYFIENFTGISNAMVEKERTIEEILPEFMEFIQGSVLVAHNAKFDISFIENKAALQGYKTGFSYGDTLTLSRMLYPEVKKHKLNTIAKRLGIPLEQHHRALADATCTAKILIRFFEMFNEKGINNLKGINEKGRQLHTHMVRKSSSNHIILLAANEIGRINLYTLVSKSNVEYFERSPRIPRSELIKHREGLIIGSACEAGELYQAIFSGYSEQKIEEIASFYDYLEIQPIGNNEFLLRNGKVDSEEELREINRKIVFLGEKLNKPVVATCDVHFLNPEDDIYRKVIMNGLGFDDADHQAPLYFRTTEEMLKEFAYLGEKKAKEVVITNTQKVADQIDVIAPFRPDKCPPIIENSDIELRDICYEKAKSLYGDPLPEIVSERLERELNSIISNGFAVMYIIAQKLVWKSNEDGYMVGSRGSVGSSFVATMAGITEVNPLAPHYYCKACQFSDFDSENVVKFSVGSGCDLPDRNCPHCGTPLNKDGFDIPFETFLGFKGDKEPDIDLNFSGDYQSKAHDYTEEIFGKGQTFRAGTISKLQEKNALGYVRKYFEEKDIQKRKCEMERIAKGCIGVKKTTGQHPGGIIVLPHGENINSFTPVQKPANDMSTKIITTQFDYHSIDHNLLKLDILGHDDPTMIRMLEELTGVDAKSILLDNKEVLSLFEGTDALGIHPEDIDGCELGVLGLPEFGTDFVIQMLIETKPKNFSDLIKISGLSHGTEVWVSNAQTLIKEGKATLATAICTRDDILTYLIRMNLEPSLAFKIMESVRKGKGLKPEWEEEMKKCNVPEWYIWSCKKIQYMFPKAHAAAYVMMAFRIAYFKVFYPLAYYAAFFSIRSTSFDYEKMGMGKEKLDYYYFDYKKRKNEGDFSPKEEDQFKDMKVVREMYARGFDFMPVDVYRAKATRFQVIEGKLMPALNTIEGLGEKAAFAIEQVAIKGRFLSKQDFREKTKVSKTVIELMEQLGMLTGLSDTNQISLFDF